MLVEANFKVTNPDLAVAIATLIKTWPGSALVVRGKVDASDDDSDHEVGQPYRTPGLELPHGTVLYHRYKEHDLYATIDDGAIRFGDQRFDHLSKAADAAGKSVDDACHAPNGFKWWRVERDGEWVQLDKLRK
jgi:hypothetical protein